MSYLVYREKNSDENITVHQYCAAVMVTTTTVLQQRLYTLRSKKIKDLATAAKLEVIGNLKL